MATHEQCYITCDKCGKLLEDENGTVTMETEGCIKDEAEDFEWQCRVGLYMEDFCKQCKLKGKDSNERK